MKRASLPIAGILGGLTSVVVIASTYLGDQLSGLPFVPYDIFDWMARHLPGRLIAFVIDAIVRGITALQLGPTAATAKLVEQGLALTQFIIGGIILGIIIGLIAQSRADRAALFGAIVGAFCCAAIVLIEISLRTPPAGWALSIAWLALVFVSWGAVLGRLIRESAYRPYMIATSRLDQPSPEAVSRRQFLYLASAGSFAILLSAAGLRFLRLPAAPASPKGAAPSGSPASPSGQPGAEASPQQTAPATRFEPVAGTRPELTPNDQFYRIDIDSIPPKIDEQTWRLEVAGLVDKPLALSLADIRARQAVTQPITLECISNLVGGDLISTSRWTGVPLKDILNEAGLKPSVKEIAISAVDGFYESVPLNEALDSRTLLVFEMNGEPLPVEHGFPLRIYIPGHYGMKQPKWITRLEAIEIQSDHHKGPGYWVDRGWSPTAVVRTTSVVDNVATDQKDPQSGLIPVGGIAYAGARGINRVEVQVDDGPWETAELRSPPLGPLTWVQWRYNWKSSPDRHRVRVRAYNGQGVMQETDEHPPLPNGATGLHTFIADIKG